MLTAVRAYSSWRSAPTLLLDPNGRPETDLIQIRNIDGLDPVKAAINTTLYGSVDGAAYIGGSIGGRNLVLTIHPNPDWDRWSYEELRRLVYAYFMPKRSVRLVFESDDMSPVEISGIVEDIGVNPFSKDQEYLVSIICPDPYFTTVDPIIVTGQANTANSTKIDYKGTIETGFIVYVAVASGPNPAQVEIQVGSPPSTDMKVAAALDPTNYFQMSSVARQKFVQTINIGSGVITNQLSHVLEGSTWPLFQPGLNDFWVRTDKGTPDWELIYYERFGGL